MPKINPNLKSGNYYNKHISNNFIVKSVVKNFYTNLLKVINKPYGKMIEIGCGEGHITSFLKSKGINILGNVEIGRFTSLNGPNFDIYARLKGVIIGSFCSIARNVAIQEISSDHMIQGVICIVVSI